MKIPIIDKLNKKIGIDLGSSRIRIWVDGAGVVLDEPNCIAFDSKNKTVLAVGSEAVDMDGRVAAHITVMYPIINGEIFDIAALSTLVKIFLGKAVGTIALYNPIIMASTPIKASQADREITTQVLHSFGAGEVYTIAEPLAASIGSGVPIADASGSFVLQLGAGVVSGVIISLGSIIVSKSNEYAGEYLNNAIRVYVEKQFGLIISTSTAQKIKKEVISLDLNDQREQLIAGQDALDESPKELMVKSKDFADFTLSYLEKIENLVVDLLSKMPPELAVDVIDKGLLLTGGTAQILGIEAYFTQKLGIPVSVVDEADQVVIKGIGRALEHLDLFKQSLGYQE